MGKEKLLMDFVESIKCFAKKHEIQFLFFGLIPDGSSDCYCTTTFDGDGNLTDYVGEALTQIKKKIPELHEEITRALQKHQTEPGEKINNAATLPRIQREFSNEENGAEPLKNKLAELANAANPLMVFLAKNYHPHCTAIVDSEKAEILEGILCHVDKSEKR